VGPSDPVSSLGLSIALILVVAKIGGDLASRLRQPPVLGELLAGVVLGSIPLPVFESIGKDPYVDMLARLGVLVLLFEIGLETTVREVMAVGFSAARVAVLGTVGTLLAGWGLAVLTMPSAGTFVHLFVAAALGATSIGVSARVLKDSGAARSREAHTILAASVLDDLSGLILLALFSGAASSSSAVSVLGRWAIGGLVAKTLGFLLAAIVIAIKLSPALFRLTSRLRTEGALIAAGLSFCFVLAWAANAIGLAPIVGAFTAGLALEESHSAVFVARGERSLRERMEPISSLLVPIFFVTSGMHAHLSALGSPSTLIRVAALFTAAVLGKLACALGTSRGVDRLTVAAGMLPRGEVSLVFANTGRSLSLLDSSTYAAILAVVVLTALTTPTALRWRLSKRIAPQTPEAAPMN
jgi:Kef-type K+ transport system membrane component KefB